MPAQWDEHNVTDRIREILRSVPTDTQYGTGRPFLMSYQIAIEFARRFPEIVRALGHPVRGEGQGPFALTTYLARWLPDRIRRGADDIEMGFLAPDHLVTIKFNDDGRPMRATTHEAGFNSTMFRARD